MSKGEDTNQVNTGNMYRSAADERRYPKGCCGMPLSGCGNAEAELGTCGGLAGSWGTSANPRLVKTSGNPSTRYWDAMARTAVVTSNPKGITVALSLSYWNCIMSA